MAKLALRDAVLGYDRAGSGPALVFLHGVGSVREVWRPQVERFSRWFTCVALDLRGHGESAAEPETISLESWASDVLEALDALELADTEPPHRFGHGRA